MVDTLALEPSVERCASSSLAGGTNMEVDRMDDGASLENCVGVKASWVRTPLPPLIESIA